MYKKFLLNVKSTLAVIVAVILMLCFGFAALGCSFKFETEYGYIARVIKEEYDVEKILWLELASNCNAISGIDYYSPSGNVQRKESLFSITYPGWYVLGIDNRGYEKFILVPRKNDSKIKPRVYQWPFAYSFTEIANFAAEYGYEYADGIDGKDSEEYWGKVFRPIDREDDVKETIGHIGKFTNDDGIYDRLDAQFILYFRHIVDDNQHNDYYIMQEGGRLMVYEDVCTYGDGEDLKESFNVIEYKRDKQDIETTA